MKKYINAIRTGISNSNSVLHWGDVAALTAFVDATKLSVVVQHATEEELNACRTQLYVPNVGLVVLRNFKVPAEQLEEVHHVHAGWEFNYAAPDLLWLSYRKVREVQRSVTPKQGARKGKAKPKKAERRAAHFNAIVWRDSR